MFDKLFSIYKTLLSFYRVTQFCLLRIKFIFPLPLCKYTEKNYINAMRWFVISNQNTHGKNSSYLFHSVGMDKVKEKHLRSTWACLGFGTFISFFGWWESFYQCNLVLNQLCFLSKTWLN